MKNIDVMPGMFETGYSSKNLTEKNEKIKQQRKNIIMRKKLKKTVAKKMYKIFVAVRNEVFIIVASCLTATSFLKVLLNDRSKGWIFNEVNVQIIEAILLGIIFAEIIRFVSSCAKESM